MHLFSTCAQMGHLYATIGSPLDCMCVKKAPCLLLLPTLLCIRQVSLWSLVVCTAKGVSFHKNRVFIKVEIRYQIFWICFSSKIEILYCCISQVKQTKPLPSSNLGKRKHMQQILMCLIVYPVVLYCRTTLFKLKYSTSNASKGHQEITA